MGNNNFIKDCAKSCGKNDDCFTSMEAVTELFEIFAKKLYKRKIWFCFDNADSNFVKYAKMKNISCYYSNSNIYEIKQVPMGCQILVSNPPYSNKTEMLKYLLNYKQEFWLLMGTNMFNQSGKEFNNILNKCEFYFPSHSYTFDYKNGIYKKFKCCWMHYKPKKRFFSKK